MAVNRFVLNGVSYHGHGAINEIPGIIQSKGLKKAFVASDPDLVKFGVTAKVTDLLDKNNMLYVALQCMNELLPAFRDNDLSEDNPFTPLFEGLDSDYLIALNTGAVWNVISLWVHRGMKDKPDHVKETVGHYIKRLGSK